MGKFEGIDEGLLGTEVGRIDSSVVGTSDGKKLELYQTYLM